MKKRIILATSIMALSILATSGLILANAQKKDPGDKVKGFLEEGFRGRLISGTVISTEENSLVINVDGEDYTVNIQTDSILTNRIWDKISLNNIEANDKILVYGRIDGDTIDAKMIRDFSQPPPRSIQQSR